VELVDLFCLRDACCQGQRRYSDASSGRERVVFVHCGKFCAKKQSDTVRC
jgi:hypothetical protein